MTNRSRLDPLQRVVIGAIASAIAWAPSPAEAADCSTVNKNPVVWVTGTAKNYLAALARALYVDTNPITILWRGNSSCDALNATLAGAPLTDTASYWDPSVTPNDEVQCTIGPLTVARSTPTSASRTCFLARACRFRTGCRATSETFEVRCRR